MFSRKTNWIVLLIAVGMILSIGVGGVVAQETTPDDQTISSSGINEEIIDNSPTSEEETITENGLDTKASDTDSTELTVSTGSSHTYGDNTDSVTILVGATNTSGLVPESVSDVPLTIEITQPDGTVTTYNRTTDSTGTATVTVSPDMDGVYDVEASSSSPEVSDYGWGEFGYGSQTVAYPGIHDAVEVGQPTTVAIAAMDNGEISSNTQQKVIIEGPSGTQSQTVETNDDGYATVQFTPEETGDYTIEGENSLDSARLTAGVATAKVQFNTPYADNIHPNQTVAIYGQVKADGGTFSNEDVTAEVYDWDAGVIEQSNVKTNENGQFMFTFKPTSDQIGYQHVRLKTASGDMIAVSEGGIDIEAWPEKTDATNLDIDLDYQDEDWDPTLAPGEEATVDVTVLNDGSPVTDATVDLRGHVGYPGAVLTSGSVTTNSSGSATYSFSIPTNAPTDTNFELEAATSVNGESATETRYGDISYIDFTQQNDYSVSPGSNMEYSTTAVDAVTGDPISDVPTHVFLEKNAFNASIVASDLVKTGSDGQGTTTLPVGDWTGEIMIADWGPVRDAHYYSIARSESYEINTQGLSDEYAAEDTVSFTYNPEPSESVSANVIVAAGDRYIDQTESVVLHTQQAAPGETISFAIPSDAPQSVEYDVTISATTSTGDRTVYNDEFSISDSATTNTPPTASFTATPDNPSVGESITFDATGSSDDGVISNYEWDFTDDGTIDATGATVTHTFQSAGSYNVTLKVTDEGGLTDSTTQTVTVTGEENGPVYEPGSAAAEYDNDGDGKIQLGELGSAAEDYATGDIGLSSLGAIAEAYAQS